MAYVEIDPNTIKVGDPVTEELLLRIKNNFFDHEDRLNNFEAGSVRIPVFKMLVNNSKQSAVADGVAYYIVNQNFNITNGRIKIFTKGGLGGVLEIDVKKSSSGSLSNGSFSSIFTIRPKITYASSSDYAISTNQSLNANAQCLAGDILRLDITQVPSGGIIRQFLTDIDGEL